MRNASPESKRKLIANSKLQISPKFAHFSLDFCAGMRYYICEGISEVIT